MSAPLPSPDPAWVALALIRHVGIRTLRALLDAFDGDAGAALRADTRALRQVRGVGPKIASAIRAADLAATEAALQRWTQAGVRLLPYDHPAYPTALYAAADAPPLLFVYGRGGPAPGTPARAVALVGCRRPSGEALALTRTLAAQLAEAGVIVVSGLAYGIDKAAHQGALIAAGRTLAVLGGGVLRVYPPAHEELSRGICLRGALLSEVAPDAPVNAAALVARNRIISGLSEALVVIETEADGGAMHAARFAQAQGRRVIVAERPASGNQALLEAGAEPLTDQLAWL